MLISVSLRGRRCWLLAAMASSAALASGCYWTSEDTEKFRERHLAACELIDAIVAAGVRDAETTAPSNPDLSARILETYMTTAMHLRMKKGEAALAFLNCDSDYIKRILKDTLEILEEAARKGGSIYRHLKPLFGLIGAMAKEFNVDIRARPAMGFKIAGEMRRVFIVDPASQASLDYGAIAGLVPLRDDLPARGTITVWPRVTAVDTATLSFSGLELELDCPQAAGLTVLAQGKPGGFNLNATSDASVFPGGWRAAFAQELLLTFRVAGDSGQPMSFEQFVKLTFYFSRDFDELAISTDGYQAMGNVFGAREKAPGTHAWGFWTDAGATPGQPARISFEGLEPGARVEMFLSPRLAEGGQQHLGLPWMIDAAAQTLVAAGDADAEGHGALTFVPGGELDDQRVFLQGVVASGSGLRPTAPLVITVQRPFRRGDINADGVVNVSDVVACMGYLFAGASEPSCLRAADANASDVLDISDGVTVLYWLFAGGPEPPAPGPFACGRDELVSSGERLLSCAAYSTCRG